jgi:hypothetical protein
MKVTIYYIEGIKVGCTNNIKSRSKTNMEKYGDNITIEILEEFEGDIHECADRESFWSERMGFGIIRDDQRYDSPANLYMLGLSGEKYNHTKLHGHSDETKLSQSLKMKEGYETGRIQRRVVSDEEKSNLSERNTGEGNPMYGKPSSDIQKEAVGAIWRGKHLSEEHKRKQSEAAKKQKKVTCKCGKVGNPGPMVGHFKRCEVYND